MPAGPTILGRNRVLARVRDALEVPGTAVTLLGPGGIGKTSVARAVADPCLFVDLSVCAEPDQAVVAVAEALGLSIAAARSIEEAGRRIGEALAGVDAPIIFDNLEQIATGIGPHIQGWVDRGARRVLTTSRISLDIPCESIVEIGGLDLLAARALFAQHADPRVVDLDRDRLDVDALIAAVGGSPLAIELAAASTALSGVAQLRARLEAGAVLHDVQGRQPHRHASLAMVVEASWVLLPEPARAALRRLCLWEGSFTATQAERHDVPAAILWDLVRRSMLAREVEGGAVRLRLYPEVRAVLRDRAAPTAAEVAAWATALVDESERHGQFRGRVGWSEHRPEAVALLPSLRVAARLAPAETAARAFFVLIAHYLEVMPSAAVNLVRARPHLVAHLPRGQRARLDALMGTALERSAGADAAIAHFRRAAIDADDDPRGLCSILCQLSRTLMHAGRYEEAEQTAREAIERYQGPDGELSARAWMRLGSALLHRGDPHGARDAMLHALDGYRVVGYLHGLGTALSALGMNPTVDPVQAAAFHAEAVSLLGELGDDPRFEATIWANRAARLAEEGSRAAISAARTAAAAFRRCHQHEAADRYEALALVDEAWSIPPADARARLEGALAGDPTGRLGFRIWSLHPTLGILCMELENLLDAKHHFERLCDLGRHYETPAAVRGGELLLTLWRAEAGEPSESVTGDALVDAAVRVWSGNGDPAAVAAMCAEYGLRSSPEDRHLARLARRAVQRPEMWRLGRDGCRFTTPEGDTVDITRRGAPRRILKRLVEAREHDRGAGLELDALVAGGWPGERLIGTSGKTRLHSAIRELRRLGLEPILQTVGTAYRLDPDAAVIFDGNADLLAPAEDR